MGFYGCVCVVCVSFLLYVCICVRACFVYRVVRLRVCVCACVVFWVCVCVSGCAPCSCCWCSSSCVFWVCVSDCVLFIYACTVLRAQAVSSWPHRDVWLGQCGVGVGCQRRPTRIELCVCSQFLSLLCHQVLIVCCMTCVPCRKCQPSFALTESRRNSVCVNSRGSGVCVCVCSVCVCAGPFCVRARKRQRLLSCPFRLPLWAMLSRFSSLTSGASAAALRRAYTPARSLASHCVCVRRARTAVPAPQPRNGHAMGSWHGGGGPRHARRALSVLRARPRRCPPRCVCACQRARGRGAPLRRATTRSPLPLFVGRGGVDLATRRACVACPLLLLPLPASACCVRMVLCASPRPLLPPQAGRPLAALPRCVTMRPCSLRLCPPPRSPSSSLSPPSRLHPLTCALPSPPSLCLCR